MIDRGIYLPCSQYEALFVSAVHTEADIDATIAAAKEVLAAEVDACVVQWHRQSKGDPHVSPPPHRSFPIRPIRPLRPIGRHASLRRAAGESSLRRRFPLSRLATLPRPHGRLLPDRGLAPGAAECGEVQGDRHQPVRRLVERADRGADRRTPQAQHAGDLRPERLRPEAPRRADHRRLDARRRARQRPVARRGQGLRPADQAGEDHRGLQADQGPRRHAGRCC